MSLTTMTHFQKNAKAKSNNSIDIATMLENSERMAGNTLTTETMIFSAVTAKWETMVFALIVTLNQNNSTASLNSVHLITASSPEIFTLKPVELKSRKKMRKRPHNYQTGMMSTTTMSFMVTIFCGTNQTVLTDLLLICVLPTTKCMMQLN